MECQGYHYDLLAEKSVTLEAPRTIKIPSRWESERLARPPTTDQTARVAYAAKISAKNDVIDCHERISADLL
jgi:hypothetical protein